METDPTRRTISLPEIVQQEPIISRLIEFISRSGGSGGCRSLDNGRVLEWLVGPHGDPTMETVARKVNQLKAELAADEPGS
jgi:hypothetical protein